MNTHFIMATAIIFTASALLAMDRIIPPQQNVWMIPCAQDSAYGPTWFSQRDEDTTEKDRGLIEQISYYPASALEQLAQTPTPDGVRPKIWQQAIQSIIKSSKKRTEKEGLALLLHESGVTLDELALMIQALPQEIKSNIFYLDLYGNNLNTFPSEIDQFDHLRVLAAQNNPITTLPRTFYSLPLDVAILDEEPSRFLPYELLERTQRQKAAIGLSSVEPRIRHQCFN